MKELERLLLCGNDIVGPIMDAKRTILCALLLFPVIASAECGFYREEQTMTIIVSKKSNKCFNSEQFRTAFRQDLIASVKTMNTVVEEGPVRVPAKRRAKARHLAMQQPAKQPSLATAEYYGQQ